VAGHRLTHSSVLLQLFRPLTILDSPGSDEDSSATSLAPQNLLKSATPLDASGAYVLQASLRVYDAQKVDRMQQGTTELLNLKEMLKGAVDLEMADRLGMDTRVR
jgi:mediator of RNA polymerase II transcription subunit 18